MGGGRVLAAKLGINESNCSQWISNGYIPPGKAIAIQKISRDLDLGLDLIKIPVTNYLGV
jgi:DNA-binding transcriptional regulator YdaS (Cro superfamily)